MKMNFYEEMAVRVNISTVSCFSKWSVVVGGHSVSLCVPRMGGPMNKQPVSTSVQRNCPSLQLFFNIAWVLFYINLV